MEATQLKDAIQDLDEDLNEEHLRVELASQIQDYARQLSIEWLKGVINLLAYLKDREEHEATQELLSIPNFESDLLATEKRASEGNLVDWCDVRDDV